jgi:hypothetical protein
MNRAQLEQMALEKISKMQTVPSSAPDRAELERMALEKLSSLGQTPIDNETEASIGTLNRAQFAIEPLQSNRKAFLEQEFGADNIMEDKNGDLYLNQGGSFRPLNKKGFSVADVADVAGATPEIAGSVVGMVAGAPSGPLGALGVGSAGGAIGSGARQVLSAAIGTPQVASVGERAVETGLSAGLSGVASAAGAYLKPIAKKAMTGVGEFLKGMAREGFEEVGETASKSVATSQINANGALKPIFNEQTQESIMGELADQSGRNAVQSEKAVLEGIAERQKIPKPTYAQAAQGKALIAEEKVMSMKNIGKKTRQVYDEQLTAIKNNLENLTGRPITAQSNKLDTGLALKEASDEVVKFSKQAATEMYEFVEQEGKNAAINTQQLFNQFRKGASELKLINSDGSFAQYSAKLGLEREEFDLLQAAFKDGMDALKVAKSEARAARPGANPLIAKMPFNDANAIRITMRKTAKAIAKKSPDAGRRLKGFVDGLNDAMEETLNKEHPKLGQVFSSANKTYRKYKSQQEVAEKLFKENGNVEFMPATILKGTGSVKEAQELVGYEMVKKAALTDIADKMMILNDNGIGRARSVMKTLRDKSAAYEAALGKEHFNNIVENLHFLDRTGQPLGVSKASLYNLLDNRGAGWKGMLLEIKATADTVAESKGTTVTKAAASKVFNTTSKVIPSSGKGLPTAANILTDDSQRSLSTLPSSGAKSIAERQKEIERRKRAISGEK